MIGMQSTFESIRNKYLSIYIGVIVISFLTTRIGPLSIVGEDAKLVFEKYGVSGAGVRQKSSSL